MATGDRKYTVQESNNLALGQTKSAHLDSTTAYTPPSGSVVLAIQCIQDVKFDADGLIQEDIGTCIGNGAGTESNGHTGGTGDIVTGGASGSLFPAGTVLYGRWTSVQIHTGVCVLYMGG